MLLCLLYQALLIFQYSLFEVIQSVLYFCECRALILLCRRLCALVDTLFSMKVVISREIEIFSSFLPKISLSFRLPCGFSFLVCHRWSLLSAHSYEKGSRFLGCLHVREYHFSMLFILSNRLKLSHFSFTKTIAVKNSRP